MSAHWSVRLAVACYLREHNGRNRVKYGTRHYRTRLIKIRRVLSCKNSRFYLHGAPIRLYQTPLDVVLSDVSNPVA